MEFDEIISEFINNENYKELQRYVAHGKTTIFSHCINVAYLCYKYAINHQKKEYDIKSLVRGAMMHDMYFYDWHKKNHKRPHGFFHSKIAYNNALKYYEINKIEKNIIISHMFPLTIFKIPKYKEAWLVQKMDKKATFIERKNKHTNYCLINENDVI